MLIAVELDHRPELDSLWTFAKESLRVQSGSASGYFTSFCENAAVMTVTCLDPFGLQQMTMALILAHDRYTLAGAPHGAVDYATDARDLLTLMRHKVDENGGVKDGVTDTFDQATSLVFDFPNTSAAGVGRPSIEMPGYYDLWAQATGDPFWTMAARAARDYWRRTANPTHGADAGARDVRRRCRSPARTCSSPRPTARRSPWRWIRSGPAATAGARARPTACSRSSPARGRTTAWRSRSTG